VGVVGVGYALGASWTRPFSAPADVLTALACVPPAVVFVSSLLGPHRALVTSASERSQAGRRWPWWIVSAAVIALELSSYLELPRAAHPTLSSLYVTASGHRAVKAVIFLAWMALGWLIAGYRPHRVDAVVGHDRA
jgi:hypothetical protein